MIQGQWLTNLYANELSKPFQAALILLVLITMDVPTLLLLMLLNHGYFWWAHALGSAAELSFLFTNENSAFWFSIN